MTTRLHQSGLTEHPELKKKIQISERAEKRPPRFEGFRGTPFPRNRDLVGRAVVEVGVLGGTLICLAAEACKHGRGGGGGSTTKFKRIGQISVDEVECSGEREALNVVK